MDESASQVICRSSNIRRIYVEGYDTSLPADDVNFALREHFASCGEMIHVYIPTVVGSRCLTLNRYGFIYVRGEGAEEKALELSGSDMGGRNLVTKAYPFHETYLDLELTPMKAEYSLQQTMKVSGYDTSLPEKVVESMLRRHFSSCGMLSFLVQKVAKGCLYSEAMVTVWGEDAVEKALKLSGRDVGGLNIVVVKGLELRDLNGSDADIRKSSSSSIRRIYVEGYDTSLRTFDVALSLREHFASCGEILHIDIHPDLGSGLLNRFGFIYVNGEGAVEKVLGLGGSEMGEPNVVTKAYPFRETHYDLDLAPIKAPESRRGDIIRRICVEGYDTSLPAVDVKRILISHFATCGELVHVYIPTDVGSGRLNRFGFVYVRGEGAEKRMLRLSGSVMGEEWSVDAMSYPFRETDLSIALAPTEVNSSSSIRRIYVEGYDTSLSAYHVHLALREHFASCGEVVHVYTPTEVGSPSRLVKTLNRYGFIYVRGEGAEEKALELSGSDMGGRIVVTKAYPFHETYLDLELAPMIAAETERQHV
ncbi:unnamed protein product [Microthlaspi erraticum]|uniref:RRM domain-containing protein n=1 Tax=Microthlaspi erraticum TaxID=1685480 RepID=A0A6D2J9A6_9BRAS|nr:unnamed protein product [Microthlaspi erraticum]